MESKQVITLVFIVLILLFFLKQTTDVTVSTIPTTTKTTSTVIYRRPTATSYIAGSYNPYKAQYYN
jgi:hypothetical protein